MARGSTPLVGERDAGRRPWRNWGRNQICHPSTVVQARNEAEVQAAVRRAAEAGATVRAVGSGHSFSAVAVTDSVMVTLDRLDRVHQVDFEANTITVGAGITLQALNRALAEAGLAMTNLGDIEYQTVAGAVSTGTHGTGLAFGGLATQIRGLRMVTADGELLDCDATTNPEVFDSARVGLGALGIITRITLAVEPAFHLHAVEEAQPIGDVLDGWIDSVEGNDHFEFFWIPGTRQATTKTNTRTLQPRRPLSTGRYLQDKIVGENIGFGALCAIGSRRPDLVPRLGRLIASAPSRLDYIDHSYKVFTSPRWVRFTEMEYSIPLRALPDVVRRVTEEVKRHKIDLLFPVEARAAAADDIPLSTAHGRPSAYLAVHRYEGRPYRQYFDLVEAICHDYGGRPHWGKLHFQTSDTLARRYPRWNDFQAVRSRLDPDGRFANPYLERVLGSVASVRPRPG